ncbi:uncharacterized protein L969DRAFT_43873 [Mixia osmundae IAM 14324]|uniref:D-arabinono-1,4-lactone oxidase n=1 Tax=Mixia osmundae (strain CBS 9802 / IAM 14324 / JCM 22182 / KY 12970) TaxID=764103 RepID=G7DTC3_MIXOS|nr:uncharacterized protein L969DRAFT_43873 [Mixia osmundae IAM 14324]KEI42893.1 hypothetical protein L969DRAFT_43873 [Mixia osmundae IAM 14324]GAA93770.1 hypothetical protein E5Q_00416 [Mixia osmundae IAM 14324]
MSKTNGAVRLTPADLEKVSVDELMRATRSLRQKSTYFTNWAGSYRCRARAIFKPNTERQVQQVVELTRRQQETLRCYGTGHSPSDLACTDGFMLNLDNMQEVLDIDQQSNVVTVQGGIKLHRLHPILERNGLAMSVMGSISDQSIAGAISTATHGTGIRFGNISTYVRSMTLVLADASIVTIDREHDAPLFMASLCGLGLTGVIIRVALQCEPMFHLRERVVEYDYSEMMGNLEASLDDKDRSTKGSLLEDNEHVKIHWFPHVDKALVTTMNRTREDRTPPPSTWAAIQARAIGYHWHQFGLFVATFLPLLLGYHAMIMWRFAFALPKDDHSKQPVSTRVGTPPEIFNMDCLFPQYTFEGVVPIENTADVLRELAQWYKEEDVKSGGLTHHFPVEIRFVEQDDIWLSPTYRMRGAYIGIMQYRPYGFPVPYKKLFASFEQLLVRHGGRSHWAKSHRTNKPALHKMYEHLDDFLEVRERVDPDNIFVNPYTRRHLFADVGEEVDMRRFKQNV